MKNTEVSDLSCTGTASLNSLVVLGDTNFSSLSIENQLNAPNASFTTMQSETINASSSNIENLNVSGSISTKSLQVSDPIDFSSGVSGAIGTFQSLVVDMATVLKRKLTVGTLQENGDLIVNGQTQTQQLIVNEQCSVNGDLTVVSNSNLNSVSTNNLEVNGSSTFQSAAEFESSVTAASLVVSGQALMSQMTINDIQANGQCTLQQVHTSRLTASNGINTSTITVGSDSFFNGNVTMDSGANINTLTVSNDSTLNGDVTVGTQETPKNLSVSGVLSAKTLELTDPLDFSQGITTVGIGSFGSIEAGGLSKINELLISGIVQMDNTAIFTSLADFRSDVTIQSLQVSGDTVVNKLTSSVFDSSEIEANRLVVKGQTFVDSLTVNESAAFADSVFMSSLVNINTLNVEQQSTFSGNVAVGTQQARRNMSVSGSTSLNSLQVSGSTQFSDQVNVGTSEQQRDLVVEGNISCKNINASESVVTQGLTTVAQFLSETEPVALSNKTFFVADTFKTSIFIDSTVPQYHMFSVFNKSSSKLNIQVYFNNEFDSFSAETKINVSKFRAIRKAGDIVTQLEISPAFSSILFGISSYRTVSIMFFIQPDETDPSQNIAVFQSNDFVDGITH